MYTEQKKQNPSNHSQASDVKLSWSCPVIGHIDIKRTMFGTGSTTDSNNTSSLTNLK
jgi:hypothetical protein